MLRFALVVTLFAPVTVAACHKEPPPSYAEQPLPPASGTPIGYLIDNSGQLELSTEQVDKLQAIDNSLSARNEAIDTQLREIEKPEPTEEDPKNPSPRPPNMAPGAQPTRTTKDAGKLHDARAANSKEALEKAFAVLDAKQQEKARTLLAERGITAPKPAKGTTATPESPTSDATAIPQEP